MQNRRITNERWQVWRLWAWVRLTWQYYRRECLWVLFFSLVYNALMVVPTLYMLQVFDRVMVSQSVLTLLSLTGIMLLLLVLGGLAEWLRTDVLIRLSVRLDRRMNLQVFDALFRARLKGREDSAGQAWMDLSHIRQFITGPGLSNVFDLPWILIYLALLFVMHPVLGWTAVLFMALFGILARWNAHTSDGPVLQAMESQQQAFAYVAAKMRHFEVVDAMGMLAHLGRRWLRLHQAHWRRHAESQHVMHRNLAASKFVRYSQQSIVLAVGAWLVIEGQISAGAMVAANMLMSSALRPMDMLVSTWRSALQARLAMDRIERFLQAPQTAPALPVRLATPLRSEPGLRVNKLQARSPVDGRLVLDGVDLHFPAGEVVVVKGHSGAGKTTLLRCLMGVWPDASGEVLLDGRAVDQLDDAARAKAWGYLPQDLQLLEGSMAENIARLGDAETDKVIAAAKLVGMHETLLRMPQGYDTRLQEGGAQLSGGHRQRLALARALYGEPRVLCLDEPHAFLDEAGVNMLVQTVLQLRAKGCLVIMVLHQSRLLSLADRVVELQAGRVVRDQRIQLLAEQTVQQMTEGNRS